MAASADRRGRDHVDGHHDRPTLVDWRKVLKKSAETPDDEYVLVNFMDVLADNVLEVAALRAFCQNAELRLLGYANPFASVVPMLDRYKARLAGMTIYLVGHLYVRGAGPYVPDSDRGTKLMVVFTAFAYSDVTSKKVFLMDDVGYALPFTNDNVNLLVTCPYHVISKSCTTEQAARV